MFAIAVAGWKWYDGLHQMHKQIRHESRPDSHWCDGQRCHRCWMGSSHKQVISFICLFYDYVRCFTVMIVTVMPGRSSLTFRYNYAQILWLIGYDSSSAV